MYRDVLLVGFGWLLGLLGTLVTDYIRDKRQAIKLRSVVGFELHDLQLRLVMVYYQLGLSRAKIDRTEFDWIKENVSEYDGPVVDDELKQLISKVADHNDEDFAIAIGSAVSPGVSRTAVKKYSLPTLQALLGKLVHVQPRIARELAEVVNQLDQYNQVVDEYRQFLEKTFESGIQTENYRRCSNNLDEAESMLTSLAKRLAVRIERVRDLL